MNSRQLPYIFFLATTILLLVVTITSPVIHAWGFLLVDIPADQTNLNNVQNRSAVFGALGYCLLDPLV